jgi:hypothetical protein
MCVQTAAVPARAYDHCKNADWDIRQFTLPEAARTPARTARESIESTTAPAADCTHLNQSASRNVNG